MRGLLGDRFLRRFAGDLKHWRNQQDSTGEGQNPEAEEASASGPETGRFNSHASDGDREEADADMKDVPIPAEPNKQNEIGPKAD